MYSDGMQAACTSRQANTADGSYVRFSIEKMHQGRMCLLVISLALGCKTSYRVRCGQVQASWHERPLCRSADQCQTGPWQDSDTTQTLGSCKWLKMQIGCSPVLYRPFNAIQKPACESAASNAEQRSSILHETLQSSSYCDPALLGWSLAP